MGLEGVDKRGVSNITIDSCKIHDSERDCIKITPNCDTILVCHCEIYNFGMRDNSNAEGIDNVNGDYMLIQNCIFIILLPMDYILKVEQLHV